MLYIDCCWLFACLCVCCIVLRIGLCVSLRVVRCSLLVVRCMLLLLVVYGVFFLLSLLVDCCLSLVVISCLLFIVRCVFMCFVISARCSLFAV